MDTVSTNYLPVGSKLGDYEIVRPIGSGGMGDVYEVLYHGLNEPVKRAIKTIPNHIKNDEMAVMRMKREVTIAQELSHPHIVRVYGYDIYQDHHFIVMEYVEGPNLEKYIFENGGKLDLETSLDMLRGIAEALDYAHALSEPVIHRDIKPKNLLYDSKTNILKISDFGIASKIRSESSMISQVSSITSGSPPYMPYEQFMGDKPSIEMDTYAFAIVLYEMLSGEPPFTNGDFALQHKEKKVPELSVLSEAQNKAIEKALSKEVEDRYGNVSDIISDINTNKSIYKRKAKVLSTEDKDTIVKELFNEYVHKRKVDYFRSRDIDSYMREKLDNNYKYIEDSAENGNKLAQYMLGCVLGRFGGDHLKARAYFEFSANQDCADAQYMLAKSYVDSFNKLPRDKRKSEYWLKEAAINGHAEAQYDIGRWANDKDESETLLRKAAEQGHVGAIQSLVIFCTTWGKFDEAKIWNERLAQTNISYYVKDAKKELKKIRIKEKKHKKNHKKHLETLESLERLSNIGK